MNLIEILRSYTTASQSAPEIAPEFAYEILQNERRRRIIDYLSDFEVGEEVEVSDIAEEIAQNGDYRSSYVACLQSHLPRLDPKATGLQQPGNARIVEYEEQGKTVRVRQELHVLNEAHQSCLLALQ